jgi:hypothetical protein
MRDWTSGAMPLLRVPYVAELCVQHHNQKAKTPLYTGYRRRGLNTPRPRISKRAKRDTMGAHWAAARGEVGAGKSV